MLSLKEESLDHFMNCNSYAERIFLGKMFFKTVKNNKGPVIKKFMPLVVIIGAHKVFRNFWIL